VDTYLRVVATSLTHGGAGFNRILIVNGMAAMRPRNRFLSEWMADHPGVRINFTLVERAKTWAQVIGDRSCRLTRLVDGKFP